MPDIRCNNKKFGFVSENSIGILEATCNSIYCKSNPNEITLHRWDLEKVNEDGTIRPVQTFSLKKLGTKGIQKP